MVPFKVLIAEDDPLLLDLYNELLCHEVFEKKLTTNGRDALAIYKEWKPDLIILDIMLPFMTGFMVLKEIRLHLGDSKTAILMATGVSKKESILDCVHLGIHGYLVKPFNTDEFLQKIMDAYHLAEPGKAMMIKDLIKIK